MSPHDVQPPTRVLLSFSSAYGDLARRIKNDLRDARIEVRFDQWEGGGGAPATQPVAAVLDDVMCVLPLATPSDAAPTWIGDEWRRAIYDEARGRGVDVLPLRGAGDLHAVPAFLRDLQFADLASRDYTSGLTRLIDAIRSRSGDTAITVPTSVRDAETVGARLTLPANPIVLDIGEKLAAAFDGEAGARFIGEMVPMMYDGLFYALGVQFPKLRLRFDSDVAPTSFRVVLHDVPEAQMEVRPESVLVNQRVGRMLEDGFTAEPAANPVTGADCSWIPAGQASAAAAGGLTTWDTAGVPILLLGSVLQRKAADFIGIHEVRAMLKQLEPVFPQLIAETVPKTVPLFVLIDVLRRLAAESVSIRDLRRILLALAEWGRVEHDPVMLTEYARSALKRQLTHRMSRGTNQIVVFLLDPDLERVIHDALRHTLTGTYVDLEPARLQRIVGAVRQAVTSLPNWVQHPQILTTMEIRSSVRRLVAPSMPRLDVVSYHDLRPDTTIQPIGRISLDGLESRGGVTADGVALWPAADA
jgi:type III secretory pathway component EscV